MSNQRVLIALTAVNIAVLTFSLARPGPAGAQGVVPVLRGRALELVDARGRLRASITVLPADPAVRMPDGSTGYPETVLLRLISSNGRPMVKIEGSEQGGGMYLAGESDPTGVQILTKGGSTSLKLSNKDGQEQVIKP